MAHPGLSQLPTKVSGTIEIGGMLQFTAANQMGEHVLSDAFEVVLSSDRQSEGNDCSLEDVMCAVQRDSNI